jgi:hypothetical protein
MLVRSAIAIALSLTLGTRACAEPFRISPDAGHTFDGWGTALAWEPLRIEQLPLPPEKRQEIAEKLLDLLFTTRPVDLGKGVPVEGLGLNGLRYVIQGGQNPTVLAELRSRASKGGKQFCARCWSPGWQPEPGKWDDTAEPAQRAWLQGAVERIRSRGVQPILMATAGAPPFWMTLDGSAAGATLPLQPNLDARGIAMFAAYQVGVLQRLKRHVTPGADWGVEFDLLGPLNEPNNNVWTKFNGQEGIYFPHAQQADLIRAVASQLTTTGLKTVLAANDDSRIGDTDAYNSQFSALGTFEDIERDPARAGVLSLLGQITVHTYIGDRRKDLAALARRLGKPILVSEAGCCVESTDHLSYKDSFGTAGAFWMADHIRRDVLELGARGWFFWQPDWGILNVESNGKFDDYPQYWLLRFMIGSLPARSLVLDSGNANAIVAIEDKGGGRGILHVLAISTRFGPAAGRSVDLDLGNFAQLSLDHAYRAVAPGGASDYFRFDSIGAAGLLSPAGVLSIPVPGESVAEVTLEFACTPGCALPH